MPINYETVADASRAIAFPDDVRGLYSLSSEMRLKIERYIAGVAAIGAGTADARETKFVKLVQDVVDVDELARIGQLLPTLIGLVTLLEEGYADFISPT